MLQGAAVRRSANVAQLMAHAAAETHSAEQDASILLQIIVASTTSTWLLITQSLPSTVSDSNS